ncbi:MAG TPA: rhodanese-like domain-containing protein [Lacipirellula sp.]
MFAKRCASIFVLLAATTAGIGAAEERPSIEFTKDSLEVVQRNIAKQKAVLVDVRSKEEWKEGHIKGSIFLPVTSLRKHSFDAKKVAKSLPKKKEKKVLYTFCVVGMRAKQAGVILQREGYTVRVLKPGYEELLEAGFEKGQDAPKERPNDTAN